MPTGPFGRRAIAAASLLALGIGCDPPAPPAGAPPPPATSSKPADEPAADDSGWRLTDAQRAQPLIRVGDDVMTLGYFVDTMGPDLQAWRRVNGAASANAKIDETIEGHMVNMLLTKAAMAAGYHQLPEAVALRKERLVATLGQALVDAQGEAFHTITQEDRQHYHAEHRAEFTQPAALRVSAITFASRAEAKRQLARLRGAEGPAVVMAEIGVTRDQNLGMFPVDERLPVEPPAGLGPPIGPALRRAANSLTKNGEFYPDVLEGPGGFLVLKRTGQRAERVTPPEQLKATLQRLILAERRQGLLDGLAERLAAQADITWHRENLSQVVVTP